MIVILIPLLLLLILNPFHKTMALSPSFELQEMVNKNHHWVQTYGNSDTHLKSNYTDVQSVEYISDGKTLNATFWLASGFKNSSSAIYNQPFREISYGMLIDADLNANTGYHGANYEFYIESAAGKLTEYLYQLSSTGGYRLEESHPLVDTNVLQDSLSIDLDLKDICFPSKYNVLFYTAESFKSNDVRQFTGWVTIPSPSLYITTLPSSIIIRQEEEQLIPARIKPTSGFSSDVANISVGLTNREMGLGFNPSEMQVGIIRIQPPLFKIAVPKQTSIGIYTIPLNVTIREPSVAALTKPMSINTKAGQVDPNSVISKNYPTVGYLTRPVNLTITVIPPSTIGEQFKDFWGTCGQFIGLFAGGFAGAYAKVLFDKRKKKKENACFWEGVSRKCCEAYFSKLI
jgi:hypothetical protein